MIMCRFDHDIDHFQSEKNYTCKILISSQTHSLSPSVSLSLCLSFRLSTAYPIRKDVLSKSKEVVPEPGNSNRGLLVFHSSHYAFCYLQADRELQSDKERERERENEGETGRR